MKTGPKPGRGSNGDRRTFAEKVAAAWQPLPEWVSELAALADRSGLKGAAAAIGYTPSLVSSVLGHKYAGDILGVEQRVGGALMGQMVTCPVLGEVGRDRCLQEQKEPFRATSAFRAQLFHACRSGCPHSRLMGGADERQ